MSKNSNPFIVSLCLLSFIAPQVTFAIVQTDTSSGVTKRVSSCVDLKNNFSVGATDKTTKGDVTKLQNFLVEKGYLNAADLVTTKASATKDKKGVYGKISAEAFGRFQIAANVTVKGGTGYKRAGPGSRKMIKELSCGTSAQAVSRSTGTSGVTADVGSIMRLSGGAGVNTKQVPVVQQPVSVIENGAVKPVSSAVVTNVLEILR